MRRGEGDCSTWRHRSNWQTVQYHDVDVWRLRRALGCSGTVGTSARGKANGSDTCHAQVRFVSVWCTKARYPCVSAKLQTLVHNRGCIAATQTSGTPTMPTYSLTYSHSLPHVTCSGTDYRGPAPVPEAAANREVKF